MATNKNLFWTLGAAGLAAALSACGSAATPAGTVSCSNNDAISLESAEQVVQPVRVIQLVTLQDPGVGGSGEVPLNNSEVELLGANVLLCGGSPADCANYPTNYTDRLKKDTNQTGYLEYTVGMSTLGLEPGGSIEGTVLAIFGSGVPGTCSIATNATREDLSYTVSLTADQTIVSVGEPVNFTTAVSGGNPPFQYFWEFGDGTTDSQSGATVSHAFATTNSSGGFTVSVAVTDDTGSPVTATKSIIVNP